MDIIVSSDKLRDFARAIADQFYPDCDWVHVLDAVLEKSTQVFTLINTDYYGAEVTEHYDVAITNSFWDFRKELISKFLRAVGLYETERVDTTKLYIEDIEFVAPVGDVMVRIRIAD